MICFMSNITEVRVTYGGAERLVKGMLHWFTKVSLCKTKFDNTIVAQKLLIVVDVMFYSEKMSFRWRSCCDKCLSKCNHGTFYTANEFSISKIRSSCLTLTVTSTSNQ